MAKPKPNLAIVLDDLQPDTTVKATRRRVTNYKQDLPVEETVLVGANLPPRYARNLAMLHAETGRSKKDLVQEALDMFFVAKGGASLKL